MPAQLASNPPEDVDCASDSYAVLCINVSIRSFFAALWRAGSFSRFSIFIRHRPPK
jgi:hypothetical protein